jgi:hypothetical protein
LLGEDEYEQARSGALNNAMLMAGLQGLMASGPSLAPTSFGQILGQAGFAGLEGYGQGMQQAERSALQGMDLEQMRAEQESQEAFQAALPEVFKNGQINYPALQKLALAYPEQTGKVIQAYQSAQPPKAPSVNLQFDPKTGTIFNPRTGDVRFVEGMGQAQAGMMIPENATPEQLADIYRQQGQRLSSTDPVEAKRYFDLADQVNPQAKPEKPTEGQLMAAGYFTRMNRAEEIIRPLEDDGKYPMYGAAIAGSTPFVGDIVRRLVMSPQQQQYQQAADDWIRSKLRKESGAVIGEDEMLKEYQTYFPQPGDSQAVIEQKRKARATATEAMATASGPAIQKPTGKRLRFNPQNRQIEEQ